MICCSQTNISCLKVDKHTYVGHSDGLQVLVAAEESFIYLIEFLLK